MSIQLTAAEKRILGLTHTVIVDGNTLYSYDRIEPTIIRMYNNGMWGAKTRGQVYFNQFKGTRLNVLERLALARRLKLTDEQPETEQATVQLLDAMKVPHWSFRILKTQQVLA